MGWVTNVVNVDGAPQPASIKTIEGRVVRFEAHGLVRKGAEVEILGKDYLVTEVKQQHERSVCKVFAVSSLPSVHTTRKKAKANQAKAADTEQAEAIEDEQA